LIFTIIDQRRKENCVVDFLSQLHNKDESNSTEDVFPYENLFALSINAQQFSYITNYLIAGKLPQHLPSRE